MPMVRWPGRLTPGRPPCCPPGRGVGTACLENPIIHGGDDDLRILASGAPQDVVLVNKELERVEYRNWPFIGPADAEHRHIEPHPDEPTSEQPDHAQQDGSERGHADKLKGGEQGTGNGTGGQKQQEFGSAPAIEVLTFTGAKKHAGLETGQEQPIPDDLESRRYLRGDFGPGHRWMLPHTRPGGRSPASAFGHRVG